MIKQTLPVILAYCALVARASVPQIAVGASDLSVSLSPSESWSKSTAPGQFATGAQFLLTNADQGAISFVFPAASTNFEFWGYQRSNGALYNISFDGGPFDQIDAYNASASGSDGPKQLFVKTGLSNEMHSVRIVNVFDTRPPKPQFGQMNVDHFVLTGNIPVVAPTFPADGFLVEGSLEYPYHAFLSLGADSLDNGGTGATVRVLLDSGASGSWVVWSGCTENTCSGHHTYTESAQNFVNESIQDTQAYGGGNDTTTFHMWRVNDTITFGNISVVSNFGSAFHVPSGQTLDGNFGFAKSFCAGSPCTTYPNFIEAMYEAGVIGSPVIAFFQLNPTNSPASGVTSKIHVGGLDNNRFIGPMDWIPVTQDSQWINPSAQIFVKGAGDIIDATLQFGPTSTLFDTGDSSLLGLPTNDRNLLLNLVGAQVSSTTLFPCTSSITFNFGGSQNRNYTFPLVNTATEDQNGFCETTVADFGNTNHWVAGTPFLDNYYVAFHYGEKGIGSTMGFGVKNLDSSTAEPRAAA